ncbi:MAG: lactonase family protein, partial [Ferruginibacter sp.]|nr:lactonase family protein [Ferruginibacter sp.]
MKNIFVPIFSMLCLFSNAQSSHLLIGTYDSPKSEGIYVYSFNQSNGSAIKVSHVKTSNPSFITIAPNKKYVYAVNENSTGNGKGGEVSSFAFD